MEPEEADPGLLVGRHVVEIGVRQAWPFLTIADHDTGREVRVYVDAPITVGASDPMDQDDPRLLPALDRVITRTVSAAYLDGSALELRTEDSELRISGDPNQLTSGAPWWVGLQSAGLRTTRAPYDEIRGRLLAVLTGVDDRLDASTWTVVHQELDANELGLALQTMVQALAERGVPVGPDVVDDLDALARQLGMALEVKDLLAPVVDRAAMERYLGEVQALLLRVEPSISRSGLAEAWHLVDHGEPAEGLRVLAWVIADERVHVDRDDVDGIRRLTAGIVDPDDLPSDLDDLAVGESRSARRHPRESHLQTILVLPPGFDDHAWEVESKGVLFDCGVRRGGRTVQVTFYDPVRLAQDVEAGGQQDGALVLTGVVVIPRLTRDAMTAAADHLPDAFFDPPVDG